MASRQFTQVQYTVVKREVKVYATVSVGANGAVTLQKWNYPVFGSTTTPASTYTAAPVLAAPPAGTASWPAMYQGGTEGVFSVTRTGTGLWTVKFQDSYQRLLFLDGHIKVAAGASNIVAIAENASISAVQTAGGSVVGVALLSSTATVADPTSGHIVNLSFTFADATEP
jgi:hypothetical protein